MHQDPQLTREVQIDIAEKNLARLLDWVGRVDNKSAVLLGIDTAMLGVLATLMPPITRCNWAMVVSAGLAVLLLGAGFAFIYWTNYPRTKGPSKSLLYFGAISKSTLNEYCSACLSRNANEHLNDLLEQCHRNAEIVDTKFRGLKFSFRSILAALIPWAIALYFFKVAGS